jgi:hypothetical protein
MADDLLAVSVVVVRVAAVDCAGAGACVALDWPAQATTPAASAMTE